MRNRVMRFARSNVLGLAAIFIALGGTAVASHETIFSSDIVNGEVKSADIQNGGVGSNDIANDGVNAADIATDAVRTDEIKNGQVRTNDIRNGTVKSADVEDDSLTGDDIDEGSLSGVVPVEFGLEPSTVSTASPTAVDLGGPEVTVTVGADGGFVQFMSATEVNTGDNSDPTRCDIHVTSPSLSAPIAPIDLESDTDGEFVLSSVNTPPVRFLGPGSHTFTAEYLRFSGGNTCEYRQRRLWVALFE